MKIIIHVDGIKTPFILINNFKAGTLIHDKSIIKKVKKEYPNEYVIFESTLICSPSDDFCLVSQRTSLGIRILGLYFTRNGYGVIII